MTTDVVGCVCRAPRSLALAIVMSTACGPSVAQCVAQLVPKITPAQYEERTAKGVNNQALANFITGPAPNSTPAGPDAPIFWREIHKKIEETIKSYYDNTYEPRDVICVALSDSDYAKANPVPTYSGKKIVLSTLPHQSTARLDGIFGPNVELLHAVYKAATDYIADRLATTFHYCVGGPTSPGVNWPIRCNADKKFLQVLQTILSDAHVIQEQQAYEEVSAMKNPSSVDLVSLTKFYDRVAALSYLNAVLGMLRPIPVKHGTQTITIDYVFDPLTLKLIPTLSLLDFVAERFIRQLLPYYLELFEELTTDEVSTAQVVPTASVTALPTIITVNEQNGDAVGVATALCHETLTKTLRYGDFIADQFRYGIPVEHELRYGDLIAPERRDFIRPKITSRIFAGSSTHEKRAHSTQRNC